MPWGLDKDVQICLSPANKHFSLGLSVSLYKRRGAQGAGRALRGPVQIQPAEAPFFLCASQTLPLLALFKNLDSASLHNPGWH